MFRPESKSMENSLGSSFMLIGLRRTPGNEVDEQPEGSIT